MSQNPPVSATPGLPSVSQQLVAGTSDEYRVIFSTLVQTDCSKHVEKKNGMSYLSWAFAVDMLLRVAPNAKFKVCEFGGELLRNNVTGEILLDDFGDPRVHNGEPYQNTATGYFVKAKVKVLDITREMRLPVIDTRNKPISAPSSFDINTSGMRCLTKCIAMHGLGLFLYQGEDVPVENVDAPSAAASKRVKASEAKASPAAAAGTANQLETQMQRVLLANSNNLLKFHEKAASVFTGDDLLKFREAISKRAQELNVKLPSDSPAATA